MYILIALILLPMIEIAVFIQVGGLIGVWPTLALILLTTFAGAALLRLRWPARVQRTESNGTHRPGRLANACANYATRSATTCTSAMQLQLRLCRSKSSPNTRP